MRVIVAAQILFITPPKAGCSKKKQPSYQKAKCCSKNVLTVYH